MRTDLIFSEQVRSKRTQFLFIVLTLLFLLMLLGFILVLGEGSPLAPLIYTLF